MRCLFNLTAAASILLSISTARAEDPAPASTTDNRALIGEINIEESGPVRTTYAETQDSAIQYFKNLSEVIATLSQGAVGASVPAADDNMLTYLTAAYLYCAVNFGECPIILDAILESDVINSRVSKVAQCPNMTRFWKLWVKNDMEARHKYMVRTGHLKTTSDFNQNKRPSYIKCQQTVAKAIQSGKSDELYFKERYTPDSAHTLVAARAARLLEDLKVKVPNVFSAVGTSFNAPPASAPRSLDRGPSTGRVRR